MNDVKECKQVTFCRMLLETVTKEILHGKLIIQCIKLMFIKAKQGTKQPEAGPLYKCTSLPLVTLRIIISHISEGRCSFIAIFQRSFHVFACSFQIDRSFLSVTNGWLSFQLFLFLSPYVDQTWRFSGIFSYGSQD